MSSRNVYLNDDDRSRATIINRILCDIESKIINGNLEFEKLVAEGKTKLAEEVDSVDYLQVVDSETLLVPNSDTSKVVALAAVHIGGTRLIDNRIISLR